MSNTPLAQRSLPLLGVAVVAGVSMVPTLRPGDRVLVWYGARVRPGHLVIARRPDRPNLFIVKRAVRREAGGWWLLGDNPYGSDDSRLFGTVPEESVLGRVMLRYWPAWPGRYRDWRRHLRASG
jgi:nickel-type superoxide dismutase maturation protease